RLYGPANPTCPRRWSSWHESRPGTASRLYAKSEILISTPRRVFFRGRTSPCRIPPQTSRPTSSPAEPSCRTPDPCSHRRRLEIPLPSKAAAPDRCTAAVCAHLHLDAQVAALETSQ